MYFGLEEVRKANGELEIEFARVRHYGYSLKPTTKGVRLFQDVEPGIPRLPTKVQNGNTSAQRRLWFFLSNELLDLLSLSAIFYTHTWNHLL